MPELPEVETVRRGLEKLILNKTIKEMEIRWPRIIESPEVPIFAAMLKGQQFQAFDRRGKFLIFKLTDYDLISHLRMEGKYEFLKKKGCRTNTPM
ncbi:Formamidopyrimidine-DNA glycosylase [Enterococcus sp. HSIEG1]|nr:Formamidopyrimidine-DNA glycosylase [Enterococcus sp. HSIEG1]